MNEIPTQAPPSRLTEQAQKLLEILRDNRAPWMNRKDIAKAIGKRRLTPYDIALLDLLQDRGLVQIKSRPNGTPIGYEWVYHAPQDSGNGTSG